MLDLSLTDLLLFERIATLGKLSAVAQERNVPVSQVSRGLQRIEAACRAQLVRRSTQGLSLTDEGEALLGYARRTLDEAQALDAQLHPTHGQPSGRVRVSMSPVIAQYLMVDTLAALERKHPLIELDFRVDDALVDMARDGIDIAIRTGEPQTEALIIRPLGVLHRRLYASPQYLERHGVPRDIADLHQHRFIVNSQHPHLNQWPLGDADSFTAQGPYASDNTAVIASMALAGLGIARMVSVIAEPLVQQRRLVPVLPDQLQAEPTRINAFMLAGRHRLPKIKACLDHWAQWFASNGIPSSV